MKIAQSIDDYLPLVPLPATLAVWSAILAAHLIATGGWPDWLVLAPQLAAGAALFWSGLVIKGCFDVAQGRGAQPDALLPPGGATSKGAWVLGGGLMALGLGFAALAGGGSLRIAVALGIAVLAYGGFLRDTLLGPVIMGAVRYLYWMLGLAAVPQGAESQALAVPVFLYAIALTVLADRQTRGADANSTKIAAFLLGLAALVVVELVVGGRLVEPLVLAALAPAVLAVGYWLWRMSKNGSPAAVQTLVGRLTLGLIPLDALLLAGSGHWLEAPILLALLVPSLVPLRR